MPVMAKEATISEALVKAASNPIRIKAFAALADRVASPKELAAEMGEEIEKVAYHVRKLRTLGLIEEVDTKQRRGATEHFYRGVMRPHLSAEEWESLPIKERNTFSIHILQMIMLSAAEALAAGTFDQRKERHLTRTPLLVDEEGWQELAEIHLEALHRTLEVQARSCERMVTEGTEGFHALAAQVVFEAAEADR